MGQAPGALEAPTGTDAPDGRQVCAAVAGACVLVAGVSHLALAPAHAAEGWHLFAFFVITGVAQLALAVALRWTWPPWFLRAVVTGHLALIALYVASRTIELPFVPPHDTTHRIDHPPVQGGIGDGIPVFPGSRVEPVEAVDLVCLVAELGVVVMLTALLPPGARSRLATAMALLGAAALAARGGGLLS